MKKVWIFSILIVVVIAMVWRVMATISEKKRLREKKNVVVYAHVEAKVPMMEKIPVVIEGWGDATAATTVTVTSTLAGKILAQKVAVGSMVKQGEVLAKIDRNLQPQDYSVTDLISPATGIIAKKLVDDGTSITTQTPIYIIENTSKLIVKFPVAQSDIGRVRQGMSAEIKCDAYPGQVIKGAVTLISPTASEKSRATIVEVTIIDARIKPGMHLQVRLIERERQAMLVPASAIQTLNGKHLAVVIKSPVVHKVPVEVGNRIDERIEIISGLTELDSVVSSGVDYLMDGDTVVVAGSKSL